MTHYNHKHRMHHYQNSLNNLKDTIIGIIFWIIVIIAGSFGGKVDLEVAEAEDAYINIMATTETTQNNNLHLTSETQILYNADNLLK